MASRKPITTRTFFETLGEQMAESFRRDGIREGFDFILEFFYKIFTKVLYLFPLPTVKLVIGSTNPICVYGHGICLALCLWNTR